MIYRSGTLRLVLEYYLPKEAEEQGIISVAYVVHGYRYIMLSGSEDAGYGESGSCNININCSEGQNWQQEKNAVAMILVDGERYCTGSLVNTTAGDYRPLFLTADHCLGGWANNVKYDALTDSLLNHWSFYWHYESPGCTSSVPSIKSTSGAVAVANNADTDFALLRLSENPKNKTGVMPYYLGWDRSGSAGTSGVGIHHPAGDIKKISATNSIQNYPYEITWDMEDGNYETTPPNTHWEATFYNGLIEGGSSGSPLINNNRKVIGQLHGGYEASCNTYYVKYYGKFNVSWTGNGATNNRRKLQPWLDPAGTNPTTLNGIATCPTLSHNDFSISTMSEGGNVYTLEATANVAGIDQYQWELTQGSGWTIIQHPFTESGKPYMYKVRVTKDSGGSSQAIVRGRPHSCAGWADEWIPIFLPLTSSYSMSASLGLGGTTLIVQIDTDSEAYEAAISQSGSGVSTGVTSQPVFTVRLYNSQGVLVRQTTAQAGTVSLDVGNLPNGFYILQVHDGSANPPQTQNILISH